MKGRAITKLSCEGGGTIGKLFEKSFPMTLQKLLEKGTFGVFFEKSTPKTFAKGTKLNFLVRVDLRSSRFFLFCMAKHLHV